MTWHRIDLSRRPDGVVLVAVDPESADERSSAAPNLTAALVLAQRMAEQPERYGDDGSAGCRAHTDLPPLLAVAAALSPVAAGLRAGDSIGAAVAWMEGRDWDALASALTALSESA